MVTSFEPTNPQEPPGVEPGSVSRVPLRLALSPDFSHGRLDGAWWPQSRDLGTELRDLAEHVPAGLGRVVRAVCSAPDWDRAPGQVELDGEVIQVGTFSQDGAHMVILSLAGRNLSLLLVPPDTSEAQAADVMRTASSPENRASARDILLTPVTDHGRPSERWVDHGSSWWTPHPVAPSYRLGGRRAEPKAGAPAGRDATAGTTTIDFQQEGGVYTGHAAGGRQWRITRVVTGWHLEFRDTGDTVATNAGVHGSVQAAMAEASR